MPKSTSNSFDDTARDRAMRLIKYLQELASLKTKIIRDVISYQQVLWLHEIPHEKGCFTQSWGKNEEIGTDVWVEIQKANEPILPKVPETCEPWVNRNTLMNTLDAPELFSTITVQRKQENSQKDLQNLMYDEQKLADFPEIQQEWNRYIEEQWFPWKDKHRRWHSVQKIYTSLFAIHQDQQRLGEEYELVLGLGLLMWRTSSGHVVRRHLVTAKASLEFEAKLGKFTVAPDPDGPRLIVELDMLDAQEQPFHAQQTAVDGLLSANENPWDRSSVDSVLHSLAKAFDALGEYHPERHEPSHLSTPGKPIVEFVPALILRKRSLKGLQETLTKMYSQVSEGCEIPSEFLDLAEGEDIRSRHETDQPSEHSTDIQTDDPTIYFPKLSNEEQRQIIKTLRSMSGVLVQGPPGTGKSHTIANLICHLLATGKRVLVTAQTPRALEVLNNHLPESIRPLCISLLGSGSKEQRALEASVSGILSRETHWNESEAHREVSGLLETLNKLRKEKSEINFRLRSIREADTQPQVIFNGAYQGTVARIAQQLKHESSEYNWLTDPIRHNQEMPLSRNELEQLRESLLSITPELEIELTLQIPNPNLDLPSKEHIQTLVKQETDAKNRLGLNYDLTNSSAGNALQRAEVQQVEVIIKAIESLISAVRSIKTRPLSWIKFAVQDMLSDNDRPWRELYRTTTQNLKSLRDRSRLVDRQEVIAPGDIDRRKLLSDAITLRQYFDNGGRLRRPWFLNDKIVKNNVHLIENVRIDGHPCDSANPLRMLIEYLLVERDIEYGWALWRGKAEKQETSLLLQVTELEEHLEALTTVVSLYELLEDAKAEVRQIPGMLEPIWHDEPTLEEFLDTCRLVNANHIMNRTQQEFQEILRRLQPFVQAENSHPLTDKILGSIQDRDVASYDKNFLHFSQLQELSKRANLTKATLDQLAKIAPKFAQQLKETRHEEKWISRINAVKKAWTWARAQSWLRDFLNTEDIPSLERRVKQVENDERNTLAKLATLQAWKFCFTRLKEEHRRHLVGWQQTVKKIGKGTGKHAHKHRRDAQRQLNKCREAVPAWVMPLHRLWETIDPKPNMFDIIIVDEASQCGIDSLPLAYLGKKLLVVGDDQQISPEGGFVSGEIITRLQQQYLHDFDHADSFDNLSSLFDHGKRRFGNRIVLREHFRCMPEIIRFSNDLCYHDTPLIPLRQYPPKRLDPLKVVHVPGGYREGDGSRVVNRPEAEQLVRQVILCCEDPGYAEKTMGVIVLQGEAQAQLIENMLVKKLGAEEMEKRKLVCGNPYHFQGDERHIIFLSMVAAQNERIGPFTKEADRRRFNVAASRAEDQMWLFHTVTLNDLSGTCFRKHLLEYFQNPQSQISQSLGNEAEQLRKRAYSANRQIEIPPRPFDSWFELDVCLSIAQQGYRVVPQYPIAGKFIDIVVEGKESQLAVECDGDHWHGLEQYERDMERQRKLERSGWKFYRIRECEFYANPESTLEGLWIELEQHNIYAIGSEQSSSGITHGDKVMIQDAPLEERAVRVGSVTEPTTDKKPQKEISETVEGRSLKRLSVDIESFPQQDEDESFSETKPGSVSTASELEFNGQQTTYLHWETKVLPDPRFATLDEIIKGLLAIITAEGPMVCHRAYFLYARAVDPPIMRVGGQIRKTFNKAIRKAIKERIIEYRDENRTDDDVFSWIVRRLGTKPVWVRTRGERDFGEIPSEELGAMMKHLYSQDQNQNVNRLFQEVLARYDISRLTSNIRERLSRIRIDYVE